MFDLLSSDCKHLEISILPMQAPLQTLSFPSQNSLNPSCSWKNHTAAYGGCIAGWSKRMQAVEIQSGAETDRSTEAAKIEGKGKKCKSMIKSKETRTQNCQTGLTTDKLVLCLACVINCWEQARTITEKNKSRLEWKQQLRRKSIQIWVRKREQSMGVNTLSYNDYPLMKCKKSNKYKLCSRKWIYKDIQGYTRCISPVLFSVTMESCEKGGIK